METLTQPRSCLGILYMAFQYMFVLRRCPSRCQVGSVNDSEVGLFDSIVLELL